MKELGYTILLLLLGISLNTYSQTSNWEKVFSKNEYQNLGDLKFFNSQVGVLCVYGVYENFRLFRTSDAGLTWVQSKPILAPTLIGVMGETGIIIHGPGAIVQVMRTTNQGITWDSVAGYGFQWWFLASAQTISIQNSQFAFVGTRFDSYITTNGGYDWSRRPNPWNMFDSQFLDNNIGLGLVHVTIDSDALIKTTNGGYNWSTLSTHANKNNGQSKFHFFSEDSGLLVCGSHILKTYDGGMNWYSKYEDQSLVFCDISFKDENRGYVIGNRGLNGVVLYTNNGGESWGTSTFPFSDSAKSILHTLNAWYIRGLEGVYKLTESIQSIEKENEMVPFKFFLSQNYPNPFNPSTIISFSLPKKSDVYITIYDITGKEIQQLFEGVEEAGKYEVSFDGSNLSSGVYFYKLRAGDFTSTKKMILVK